MPKPRLLVVTKSRDVYHMFCAHIAEYFHDQVEVLDGQVVGMESNPDLILASYREIMKESRFPQDKLMVARRTIDLSKTEDLVALPSGTRCLVVNNSLDTAEETISCLENLGLELELYPYDPTSTAPLADVDVALVAQTGQELVPSYMKDIVYIGLRPIDYATILEIAFRLEIPTPSSQVYSSTYIRQIVQLSSKLSGALKTEQDLNRQMDAIFHTVHDGLIAISKNGEILQANHAAYKILGLNPAAKSFIGQDIDDVFQGISFNDISNQANIHHVNDVYLVMNRMQIDQGRLGWVLAFQDVTRLQKLEQDFRQRVQAKGLSSRYSEENIISSSDEMMKTLKIMRKIARTDGTIIILGESGTGKELFVHAIHQLSSSRHGPFLPVNFAGLPESLAESELFGYEEGAFTGARRGGKPGLFELAHNGTLFLDEIGDASLAIQALLLRVLQERQVMRVGGERVIPINVRIIAATNRDLRQLVEEGKFRHDLYYRLYVLPLHIPALRERREDIPLLMNHFVQKFSRRNLHIPDFIMNRIVAYDWPGNVRELEAAAQYITSVAEEHEVTLEDLPHQFGERTQKTGDQVTDIFSSMKQLTENDDLPFFYAILTSLEWAQVNGHLGIGRNTIVEYVKQQGVSVTEQEVRNRMATLRRLGFIETGMRRRGSHITDKGKVALGQLRERFGGLQIGDLDFPE